MAENKGFKAGLENLLAEAWREDTPIQHTEGEETSSKPTLSEKRLAVRNFTESFDALFEEAMEETIAEKVQAIKSGGEKTTTKRRKKSFDLGLDRLIRSTIETSTVEIEESVGQKRVVFVFDEQKLDKLKTIARLEKTYLKDILNELVTEFIQEYESKKKI